jgi:phage FluMu protein Com
MTLHEYRCQYCGKLLFRMHIPSGIINTKCPRCGMGAVIEIQDNTQVMGSLLARVEQLEVALKITPVL